MRILEWLNETARKLSSLFSRRDKFDRDIEEEMRLHRDLRAREHREVGIGATESHYAAQRRFGNTLKLREEIHQARGWTWIDNLLRDLKYGGRQLRKHPGFTLIAMLTLALGIGACTAIFSVVYGVLLQPLPYKDSSRLIVVQETTPKVGIVGVSYPNFLDWRSQSHTFAQMAGVYSMRFNLAGLSQPENIVAHAVSPNFLSMLGVRPAAGRDFNASEEQPGAAPVVMLSYDLWQSHFSGDPGAVGRAITLDDRSFTIVGVLPANFRSVEKIDAMVPIGTAISSNDGFNDRGARGDLVVIGRLAPDSRLQQARAEMEGIAARLAREYPATNDQFGVNLQPLRDAFVGDTRLPVLILFGAVMFVLLIACANVANLFLVRGASRNREIALRIALGASRSRIIRQMLTESLVLACFGGLLGVALAMGGIRGIIRLIPMGMLSGATVSLNGAVLLFAAGVVALSTFVFGLAPALNSARPDAPSDLKESGRTVSASAAQSRLRGILAIGEISLALVLLVGAGLMIRSLYRLLSVDPGFQTSRVLTMRMDLRTAQYAKEPEVLNFWAQALDRVHALPGVDNVALGTVVPLTDDHSRTDITIENMTLPKPGSYPHPDVHIVSSGYMATLGVPLLRGRLFTDSDDQNAPKVGLINAITARQYFPNQDPVGKRFMFGHPGKDNHWITIVGVAGDTKLYGLANPARLEVYVPFRQLPTDHMMLLVKSGIDPAALTSAVRDAIASIDKDQPIFSVVTMSTLYSDSLSTQRVTLIMLGAFSALALVLAAIGIYGVISYAVTMRTREIGIRLALGAQRTDVLRMVVGQGAALAITGVALGLATSFALTRLMSSLLFGVSATDPLTFAGVAILLTIVALAASYIPAHSAMRVDPVIALRAE